jgi:hypothetical protein
VQVEIKGDAREQAKERGGDLIYIEWRKQITIIPFLN